MAAIVQKSGEGATTVFYARIRPHEPELRILSSPRTIALVGKYHSLEIAESPAPSAEYLHERGISVFHRARDRGNRWASRST
jgi:hypothetical protein